MESQQNTDSRTTVDLAETAPEQAEKGDTDTTRAKAGWHRKLSIVDEIIFYGLIILSLIGAVVAQFSPDMGRNYWLVLIPVIGLATICIEWSKVRRGEVKPLRLIVMQFFHWGSLVVAVELVTFLAYFGRITNTAVSSVTLLLLAQTTFVTGVDRDWRFCVVAIFQVLCLVVLTYLETYIWALLLVAIAIIVIGIYLHKKFRQISLRHHHQLP
ncbi:MAG: hypothetical protein L0H73_13055 [Nitrococcus sp.]|nr:hypothetical protein [Nitrococcus sp.]